MRNNSDKNVLAIPKKAFLGIAPAVAIIAVLLSKDKAPEVLLFLIGISAGLIIGMNLRKKQE